MRVRNRHTACIDHVEPGAEGDLPDTAPVRGLVVAGLLVVVAPPIAPPSDEPSPGAPGDAPEAPRRPRVRREG